MTVELAVMTLQEAAQTHEIGEWFDYEDKQYKRCKNDAIMDCGSGKFVYGVPPLDARITAETAPILLEKRWHGDRQEAARLAVQHALNDDKIDTIQAADAYMTYAIVREGVLASDVRLDWRVKAWEAVLERSGMSGKAPKQAQQQVQGATLSMDRETAVLVARAVAQEMAKQGIVDG